MIRTCLNLILAIFFRYHGMLCFGSPKLKIFDIFFHLHLKCAADVSSAGYGRTPPLPLGHITVRLQAHEDHGALPD